MCDFILNCLALCRKYTTPKACVTQPRGARGCPGAVPVIVRFHRGLQTDFYSNVVIKRHNQSMSFFNNNLAPNIPRNEC